MPEPTGLAGLPYIDGKKTIGDLTMAVADARYVNVDGDTMTGDLLLSGAALASAFSTSPLTLRGGGSGADIFRLNSWNNSRILTVNSSGQFGINTDPPLAMLDVAGATGIVVRSVQGSTRVLELTVSGAIAQLREGGGLTGDELRLMQTALGTLTLWTNSIERIRIEAGGPVNIYEDATGLASSLASLLVANNNAASAHDVIRAFAKNAAFDGNVMTGGAQRVSSGAFNLLSLRVGMNADGSGGTNRFLVGGDGKVSVLAEGAAVTLNASGEDARMEFRRGPVGGPYSLYGFINVDTNVFQIKAFGASTPLSFWTNDTKQIEVSTVGDVTLVGAAGRNLYLENTAIDPVAETEIGNLWSISSGQDVGHSLISLIRSRLSGPTSGMRGGRLEFYTKLDNSTTITERLRITETGELIALYGVYLGAALTSPPDDKGSLRIFDRPQALTDPGGIEFQVAPNYGQRIVAFDNTSGPSLIFANRSNAATWTEYLRTLSTRAVIEVTGAIGNTAAILGAGVRAIAIVRDDPYIGFNAYYSGGWKAVATGAAALIGSAGEELQFYLGPSANIDAALTMTSYLTLIPTAFYPTNTSVTELGKSDKLWEIIWGSRLYLGNAATDFNLIMERYSTGVGTGPGASKGVLRWEPGTNAGTLKLVAYSGTSTTGVTIVDNVGSGN